MYIEVIPTSQSIDTEPLVYFCPTHFELQVCIGSLVEIPMKTTIIYGIVFSMNAEPSPDIIPESIRSINRVVCSMPLLSEDIILMIPKLSLLVLVPIHKILLIFLPKSLLLALEKNNFEKLYTGKSTSQDSQKQRHQKMHTINFYHASRVTPEIIATYLQKKTLVILPDDILLRSCEKYFQKHPEFLFLKTLDKQAFISSDSTPARKIRSWIDVFQGKYMICFGTRKLLYYNIKEYEHILYVEDAFAREYYQHPQRYKHIDTLSEYSRVSSKNIEILTSIPAIETLSKLRHFTIKNIVGTSTPVV